MIIHLIPHLNQKNIVLASGSPRRKEILSNLGLKFSVVTSNFAENLDKSLFVTPADYVVENAKCKVLAVYNEHQRQNKNDVDLYIGADTVVCIDNEILEKPHDTQHAHELLSKLSGRKHVVYTGVILIVPNNRRNKDNNNNNSSSSSSRSSDNSSDAVTSDSDNGADYFISSFIESTEVQFAPLSHQVIEAYVSTGEPMDKAGGYGIQGIGGSLVLGINGCYFNVMGFPLHKFCKEIARLHNEKRL